VATKVIFMPININLSRMQINYEQPMATSAASRCHQFLCQKWS